MQVKITEGGFDEQQFLSAVASGAPPDLIYLDRETIGTYAARQAIQPLDDCIAKAQIDMSQYRPAAVQSRTPASAPPRSTPPTGPSWPAWPPS